MWFFFFILLFPRMYSCDDEMDYIPKDWLDPNDMRHYDRTTKTMKYSYSGSDQSSCGICDKSTVETERFEIFIERFINRILQSANLKDRIMKPGTKIVTEIPVSITAEELNELAALGQQFKTSKLNELDNLLSVILSYERGFTFDSIVSYLNPIEELFFNMSMEKVVVLICISIAFVTIWMFAVGKSYKKIMFFLYLVCFLGGLAFNAWYMYMEAISEQIAESKHYMAIPDVCNPKKTSWWSYLFSSKKECLEFEKVIRINPLAKVIPSVVFSHTLSMMFIHPLKELGSKLGDFLIGVSNAAPWPLNYIFLPFVLVVFCLLFLFLVMVQLGASFNCWTWLGGLSIKLDKSKKTYEKECEALKDELKNVKKYIKSLENNEKTYKALMDEIASRKKYVESEKEEIRRPEAGDAGQMVFQKRHSIPGSSFPEIDYENNPFLNNSNGDAADRLFNTHVNIFKVNRKNVLGRYVSPNSIAIKKKYK